MYIAQVQVRHHAAPRARLHSSRHSDGSNALSWGARGASCGGAKSCRISASASRARASCSAASTIGASVAALSTRAHRRSVSLKALYAPSSAPRAWKASLTLFISSVLAATSDCRLCAELLPSPPPLPPPPTPPTAEEAEAADAAGGAEGATAGAADAEAAGCLCAAAGARAAEGCRRFEVKPEEEEEREGAAAVAAAAPPPLRAPLPATATAAAPLEAESELSGGREESGPAEVAPPSATAA